MADIYTMGMDIGSTASKCLILKNGTEIASSAVISAGTGTSGPKRAQEEAMEKAGISMDELCRKTATGYGRNTFLEADDIVSELSCHAIGIHAVFPEVRTLIDIGGQDAKVIHVTEKGRLDSFVMNDKCAAGTGRFLEVMARILELDVSELAKKSTHAKNRVNISSTCTVFAESEVISQLAANVDICDLVDGIHRSVAVRTATLVKRLGIIKPVAMSGGVALNSGVVKALEQEIETEIMVSPLAQLNGAYGAAVYAWKKYVEEV